MNGLDELARLATQKASRRPHVGGKIRAADERRLAAHPLQRIVVVEPDLALAGQMAAELRATP